MIFGLTLLDILLVLLFVSYAISGYRQGLVVSVLSLAGFLGGGALAMWLVPLAIHNWTSLETTPLMRTVVLIVGVFVLASIGQAVAVRIGGSSPARFEAAPPRQWPGQSASPACCASSTPSSPRRPPSCSRPSARSSTARASPGCSRGCRPSPSPRSRHRTPT